MDVIEKRSEEVQKSRRQSNQTNIQRISQLRLVLDCSYRKHALQRNTALRLRNPISRDTVKTC
ncbi:hypothetical protein T06_3708 [Trichinella sp. T6]|nr:hypothetical protein T06_3708 [Trichinella sp. T6]